MPTDRTSRTAEYMAFFRALETSRAPSFRLLDDPFAASFLRPALRRAVRLARIPGIRWVVQRYADRRLPGARTSAVARTKLIDQLWLSALHDGVRQIVLLGAGFDCRAYRLPDSNCATIFEVDHPAMLALKESRLLPMLGQIQSPVRPVAIDFNRDNLSDVLDGAGFKRAVPALFVWEGVTNYLTEEAVGAVLRYVGDCVRGCRIVFTYVHRGVLDGSERFFGGKRIRRDVAAIGEPWTFGLEPAALPAFLRERNLVLDYDAGARDYRIEIYGPRGAGMRGYDFYHVAVAHVAAESSPQDQ